MRLGVDDGFIEVPELGLTLGRVLGIRDGLMKA